LDARLQDLEKAYYEEAIRQKDDNRYCLPLLLLSYRRHIGNWPFFQYGYF
jgi:hypothetical protein